MKNINIPVGVSWILKNPEKMTLPIIDKPGFNCRYFEKQKTEVTLITPPTTFWQNFGNEYVGRNFFDICKTVKEYLA